jgi:hypothetical protein
MILSVRLLPISLHLHCTSGLGGQPAAGRAESTAYALYITHSNNEASHLSVFSPAEELHCGLYTNGDGHACQEQQLQANSKHGHYWQQLLYFKVCCLIELPLAGTLTTIQLRY